MTSPPISLPRFSGPLDLLLALVRKNQVDITAIPIARITRQYLDYLETAAAMDLELGSEFTYMAATLIQIKSRFLLPADPEIAASEPDPRQELIRQLLDHEQVRRTAEFLQHQLECAGATLNRGSIEEFRAATAEDDDSERDSGSMNLLELLRLARKAVEIASTHDLLQLDNAELTVEEMAVWLTERLALLSGKERASSDDLFFEQPGLERRIALFLAILDLAKEGVIHIEQQGLFDPIFLNRTTVQQQASQEHGEQAGVTTVP